MNLREENVTFSQDMAEKKESREMCQPRFLLLVANQLTVFPLTRSVLIACTFTETTLRPANKHASKVIVTFPYFWKIVKSNHKNIIPAGMFKEVAKQLTDEKGIIRDGFTSILLVEFPCSSTCVKKKIHKKT